MPSALQCRSAHIADIEDFGVRPQTSGGFRHNRRRVGVVKHPGVRRIFFHIIHQLQHAADRAHTVGDPPGPQVSRPSTPWRSGIFSSCSRIGYLPTRICAMTKSTSVNAASRIGGIAEFNLRRLLFEDHFCTPRRWSPDARRRCRKISATATENDPWFASSIRTMPGVKVLPPPAITN